MAAFSAAVVIMFLMLYNHLVLYMFDEEYAAARGINVRVLEWVVYIMIPVGIIVLVKGSRHNSYNCAYDNTCFGRKAVFQNNGQGRSFLYAFKSCVLCHRAGCRLLCQHTLRRLHSHNQRTRIPCTDVYKGQSTATAAQKKTAFIESKETQGGKKYRSFFITQSLLINVSHIC